MVLGSIRPLLIAGCVAASFGISMPAMAMSKDYLEQTLKSHPVTKAVADFGGKVVVKEKCKGDYYALFTNYGPTAYLFICGSDVKSLSELELSLTHEAVHFSQWCAGQNSLYEHQELRAKAEKDGFSTDWADEATNDLKKGSQEYDSEWEAYYFEDISPAGMVEMIQTYCAPMTKEEFEEI